MTDISPSPWLEPSVAAELGKRLMMVARHMNSVIVDQQFPPSFLSIIRQITRTPGKLLASKAATGKPITAADRNLWPLAVVLAHAAVSSTDIPGTPVTGWRTIAPVAAAAEFLGIALDLVDDIQDEDALIVKKLGIPITLNVVIALLGLVNSVLADPQIPEQLRAPLHSMFSSAMLAANNGQYLDLSYERQRRVSTEESLKMTRQKSGSLVALLIRAGAFIGAYKGAGREGASSISQDFAEFGYLLGTIAQLENDERDARFGDPQKSDRSRGKKTLPLVFEAEMGQLESASKDDLAQATQRFVKYTADIYRIQALALLERLAETYGIRPDALQWLIVEDRG